MHAAAQRLLHRFALQAQSPLGRLAASSLRRWARRWPTLSRLLGIEPGNTGTVAAPESPVDRPRLECLTTLRVSGDPEARARAARGLGHVVDGETSGVLAAALRDPAAEVAVQAAEALRFHPREVAVPALRDVLANRDGFFSSVARAAAVRSLGALLPRGQGTTIAALVPDGDVAVSLAAIASLVERDEDAGVVALLTLLEDHSGFYLPITRQAAARALSRMTRGRDPRVGAILQHESDETVRAALSS